MTLDEIKAEISAGNIGALTLDTSVFGSPNETRLETAQLQRIAQFKGSRIQFILSDVVALEVISHLKKQAVEAQTKLNRAMRLVGRSWTGAQAIIEGAANSVLAGLPPEMITKKRFDDFLETTGGVILEAKLHAKIDELVDRYFSNSPPFEVKEAKKYEFPDAIALLTLESWALQADKKVLVVSKDDGWIKYCAASDRLVAVKQLSEALSLFHSDANFVCNMIFQKLEANEYPELVEAIKSAIDGHVEDMTFYAEASSAHSFDAEIYDISVVTYSIRNHSDSLLPLDINDDYLVAELSVSANIDVHCDFQFSTKDWIDKDYISIGSSTSQVAETIDLMAVISFTGNIADGFEIDEVEITGNRNLSVDFGDVEPDWQDYEE